MIDNPPATGSDPDRFEPWEVVAFFHLLSEDYRAGGVSLTSLRVALEDLLFRDDDGNLWTVGVQSGKWYRRAGDAWMSDKPHGLLSLASRHPSWPVVPGAPAADAAPANRAPETAEGSVGLNPATASARPAATIGIPTRKLAYCHHCGNELGTETNFCGRCGAALAVVPSSARAEASEPGRQLRCPVCGGALRLENAICERCGARLPQARSPFSPDMVSAVLPSPPARAASGAWWLLPVLLAWPGGVAAWLAVKGGDAARARRMLWLGIWMTFVWSAVAMMLLALLDSDLLDLI